ncbi:MAG TPA: hypothetical protein VFU98_12815 [Microlunatus sp.]|nr:hypothetical protein [Microlunatus sp.]
MDVEISEERVILLAPRFNLDHAEGRAWARRADAFGAVARIGGLLNRNAADDYECVYRERRLQPFWRLHSRAIATYERTRTLSIPVPADVLSVRLGDQTIPVTDGQLAVTALESCRDDSERDVLVDGLTGAPTPALTRYLQFPGRTAGAEDLAAAVEDGTVVVPPTSKASMLVREVLSSAIGRIEADRILEDRVSVDVVDLVYRPVYAFRYRHAGKEAVVEFDGLTGDVRPDGASFEQYLGKTLDPKFLLDVGVEAVNMFVPGTQLARIVVQHGVERFAGDRGQDRQRHQ